VKTLEEYQGLNDAHENAVSVAQRLSGLSKTFLGQAMGKLKIGYIVTTRSCNYQNEMKKVNN